jgi:LPXTG-motif cell wall-anchored protein
VGQNPAYDNNIAANPISDPYLALYSNFNPSDLDAGVVGCNDDAASSSFLSSNQWFNGDTFPTNGESNTNDRWSHFEADLQPGNYTAILTTWAQITAAEYTSSFAPESATFEYWGPKCGIETAACAAKKKLATTGSNSNESLFAGIALLVAGASVVRSRRRSAQK